MRTGVSPKRIVTRNLFNLFQPDLYSNNLISVCQMVILTFSYWKLNSETTHPPSCCKASSGFDDWLCQTYWPLKSFSVAPRVLCLLTDFILLERRWSSRTFRYGYLVTTSPQSLAPPSAAPSLRLGHWLRAYPTPMVWRAVCTRPGNVFTATFWFAITSDSSFM